MTDELTALRQENELLREQVSYLEGLLRGTTTEVPTEWGLSPYESKLYLALSSGELKTKEQLHGVLYYDKAGDGAELKIIDVFVCKLRKKLTPHGLLIDTVWGVGYKLVRQVDGSGEVVK